ncbi:hypothetical protein AAFF_G00350850, partial [Aldrovandia affinis]
EKSVYDLILGALDNLSANQLERFKHKLRERQEIGYGLIEKESNMAVTQRIIDKFTKKDAIARTAAVLRAIDLRDQAEDLEEAYARQGASSVAGMGDTGGRASDSSFTQMEVPERAQPAGDPLLSKQHTNTSIKAPKDSFIVLPPPPTAQPPRTPQAVQKPPRSLDSAACPPSTLEDVHILEPRTREDFLQYSCQLTLDPNTAYRRLRLSEGNREL